MAIVRGLEEGAILWKYIGPTPRRVLRRDDRGAWIRDEHGRPIYDNLPDYRLVKLYSRRNRTRGARIKIDLFPFLSKLKIRLNESSWARGQEWTAVGVEDIEATEQEYNEAVIDPVADRYYQRIRNKDAKALINKNHEPMDSVEAIETLKNIDLSEWDEDEWDENGEPIFREYSDPYVSSW